jgi:hypothetical protein
MSAGRQAIVTYFRGFYSSREADAGIVPQSGHDLFFPDPSQFAMHLSFDNSTLYCGMYAREVDVTRLRKRALLGNG